MEVFRLASLLVLCLATVHQVGAAGKLDFLRLPEHDGVSRTCTLTQTNFTTFTGDDKTTTVVFFACPKLECHAKREAEILNQVLIIPGIRVCLASSDLQQQTDGDVLIFTGGRKVPYFGRKTASSVLSFINRVARTGVSQVRVITGKLDKVAFDAVQELKLVGLFMEGTADYLAYVEASRLLTPSVHFYAVFDRTVAKHLRLDIIGEIYLYKPMHKTPVVCPKNPATAADIEAFIQDQRGAVLTKLTQHNLYDPAVEDPSRTLVVAIGEQTSPLGGYLHKLLTKTIRNNTNNTEFTKFNFVWVEPDLFPTVQVSALSQTAGIPSQFPCLGSITETSSVWFDMAQVNVTADKNADEQNVALINAWLEAILTNTAPSIPGRQYFSAQPVSQSLEDGSDFVLECRVENPVGDCLWLHNGQNLGFNMARYGGVYTWQMPREDPKGAGECSLNVTGAQAGQQDGLWVCEMTGSADNPTITSRPARITITPKGNAKTEL